MPTPSLKDYRADIDGLRAVAVVSVVLFHAFAQWIPGGFIGVDIFFVISGFLISGHIFNDLKDGRFSFANFYAKRVVRIFPALIVVLLSTWCVAWYLLFNDELKQLGNHLSRAAVFLSNFLLWHESGYFDNAAETKILLHLWSLAIEEQFYILWPVTLFAVWRWPRARWWLMLGISVASFATNAWWSLRDLTQDFYSPLTRFWELTLGALLAYRPYANGFQNLTTRQAHACSVFGFVVLAIALGLIDQSKAFPGYWALLPVLGAVLLLAAGPSGVLNQWVLSNPWMVGLGVISYPLYLWHWPVFSMVRVVQGEQASLIARLSMVGLSVCLAWMTYRWVEVPIRFQIKHAYKTWVLSLGMVCIGVLGYVTYKADGFAQRDVMRAERVHNQGDLGHDVFHRYFQDHFQACSETRIAATAGSWHGMVRCFQSYKSTQFDVALVGDSHAEHLFIGLAEAMPDKNVVFYSKPSMPLLSDAQFATVFDVVIQPNNYGTVVLTANWRPKIKNGTLSQFEQDLDHTVGRLLAAGKKVYVLSDVPQFAFDPQKCKYQRPLSGEVTCEMPRQEVQQQLNTYWGAVTRVQKKHPSLRVMDLTDLFCTSEACQMAREGVLHYRDNNHLNIPGSQYLGFKIFENL